MALEVGGGVRLPAEKLDRLVGNALSSPSAKGALTRATNKESEKVLAFAKEIAEAELNRRPGNRRTAESLNHGKEYHDSFYVVPASSGDPMRMRVKIGNNHPAAGMIEFGTPPHSIDAKAADAMQFPGPNSPEDRGGIFPAPGHQTASRFRVGQKGSFMVDGPPWVYRKHVNHPGTQAKHILTRAMDRYRKSTRANVRSRSKR